MIKIRVSSLRCDDPDEEMRDGYGATCVDTRYDDDDTLRAGLPERYDRVS